MGPDRNGVYNEAGVIDSIPESGLKIKWRTPVSGGYAGPAVADGRVFVLDYKLEAGKPFNAPDKRAAVAGRERIVALNATDGKQIWSHDYDCPYNISYPAGPRCTPTVDGDRVYVLGSEGDLLCLKTKDGELIWKKSLKDDFKAEVPIWGFSAHPLVDGDYLYTMVGGEGQGVVAFDKMTGDVKWKALNSKAGYCPPTIIERGGVRQMIVFHPNAVVSLNPADGEEYWNIPIEPLYAMSICQPMIEGNLLYASGLGSKSVMIELDPDAPEATELWRGKRDIAVYGATATPLFVDGVLYGSDCHDGKLFAVDAKDGSRLWDTFEATRPDAERPIKHGTGFVTRLGKSDRYLIMNEVGDLVLAEMTREKFTSLGRFHVLEPTGTAHGRNVVWAHPAYANKTAFIRNDKEIVAVDLEKE